MGQRAGADAELGVPGERVFAEGSAAVAAAWASDGECVAVVECAVVAACAVVVECVVCVAIAVGRCGADRTVEDLAPGRRPALHERKSRSLVEIVVIALLY